jgi:hypothetical protein
VLQEVAVAQELQEVMLQVIQWQVMVEQEQQLLSVDHQFKEQVVAEVLHIQQTQVVQVELGEEVMVVERQELQDQQEKQVQQILEEAVEDQMLIQEIHQQVVQEDQV